MCENGLKRISEQELRKIQIEILDEVDNFCRNHEINYWIDCGTLLGAVRHNMSSMQHIVCSIGNHFDHL